MTPKKTSFISRAACVAAMAAAGFAGAALAQTAPAATGTAANAAPAAAELAEGEIRKIDKENRKLTIKHGPLKSLDMPGMTMVFSVRDEAVLTQFQVGDRVRFDAAKAGGQIAVTHIEAAR